MMKMKMENDVKCSSVEVEVRSTTPIDKEKGSLSNPIEIN